MTKINITNEDISLILTIVLKQDKDLKNINELFKMNVIDDLNTFHFIYDDILRYIIETCFTPDTKSGFKETTKKLFYTNKNCWVIHNKLIELLQSSKEWWQHCGDFKCVIDLNSKTKGFITVYIFYDNMNSNYANTTQHIKNITTLKINLYDDPRKLTIGIADKNYKQSSETSLTILNTLIRFSNCTGFFKWIDKVKQLVEPLNFNDVEKTFVEARDFIDKVSEKVFISKKEYKLWYDSRVSLLEETINTFNNLEKNIVNLIDEKKAEIKKDVLLKLEQEKEQKKEDKKL